MTISVKTTKERNKETLKRVKKTQKNITSVSREDPKKIQNMQKSREKQQQDEYPGLLFDGAVLAWLEYISRLIYLGERYAPQLVVNM